jgi:hypothetical protein
MNNPAELLLPENEYLIDASLEIFKQYMLREMRNRRYISNSNGNALAAQAQYILDKTQLDTEDDYLEALLHIACSMIFKFGWRTKSLVDKYMKENTIAEEFVDEEPDE